jgi:hypothetical protein
MSDGPIHHETDLGVIDPLPERDVLVAKVRRELLLGSEVKGLELSSGCNEGREVPASDYVSGMTNDRMKCLIPFKAMIFWVGCMIAESAVTITESRPFSNAASTRQI